MAQVLLRGQPVTSDRVRAPGEQAPCLALLPYSGTRYAVGAE